MNKVDRRGHRCLDRCDRKTGHDCTWTYMVSEVDPVDTCCSYLLKNNKNSWAFSIQKPYETTTATATGTLKAKQHICPCITLFVNFFAISARLRREMTRWGRFQFNPKFRMVGPEYSGPALKVVHIVTGLVISVGRSDRNVLFHLPKLLSPVPLFWILLTRTTSYFQWKVTMYMTLLMATTKKIERNCNWFKLFDTRSTTTTRHVGEKSLSIKLQLYKRPWE